MSTHVMREDTYRVYRIRLELLLGISRNKTDVEIHRLIEAGLTSDKVLLLTQLRSQVVQERDHDIAHKKTSREAAGPNPRVNAYESDQLFRFAHITAMAQAIFGDDAKAERWLSKPKERLAGKKPYEMLSTTPGTWEVERMLIQLAEPFAF